MKETKAFSQRLLKATKDATRLSVNRRWCVINAVHSASTPKTVDVYIGGSTVLTTGLRYNGSVTAPNANEVWALDIINGDPVATYKVA